MAKFLLICTLILTALPMTGVSRAAPGASSAPAKTVGRTTVLPLSEGPHLYGSGASGWWTPGAADLKKLEAELPSSISSYDRQYLGIIKEGKRLIFINGFSESVAPEFTGGKYDWHRHAVSVMDGGRGFFHATYDPKTRKFTCPFFNGLA